MVADRDNHRQYKNLEDWQCKNLEKQGTTLAGRFEKGTADGMGAGARFRFPFGMTLDEGGHLPVLEQHRQDCIRVVEASQRCRRCGWARWAAEEQAGKTPTAALKALQEDYGKDGARSVLADVVPVVEGERFPAHWSCWRRGAITAVTVGDVGGDLEIGGARDQADESEREGLHH